MLTTKPHICIWLKVGSGCVVKHAAQKNEWAKENLVKENNINHLTLSVPRKRSCSLHASAMELQSSEGKMIFFFHSFFS